VGGKGHLPGAVFGAAESLRESGQEREESCYAGGGGLTSIPGVFNAAPKKAVRTREAKGGKGYHPMKKKKGYCNCDEFRFSFGGGKRRERKDQGGNQHQLKEVPRENYYLKKENVAVRNGNEGLGRKKEFPRGRISTWDYCRFGSKEKLRRGGRKAQRVSPPKGEETY